MIHYGNAPTNQMAFEGLGDKTYERWCAAKAWIKEHPQDWEWYMTFARKIYSRAKEPISPKYCHMSLRYLRKVSVSADFEAAFARIAKAQEPSLEFRMAKSQFDVYAEVAL